MLENGFQFVKGKSRSKRGIPKDSAEPKYKRPKMNQEMRESRLKELEDSIKDYNERITFKERKGASLNVASCDELKEAVIELNKKRSELEAELKRLSMSSCKMNHYIDSRRCQVFVNFDHFRQYDRNPRVQSQLGGRFSHQLAEVFYTQYSSSTTAPLRNCLQWYRT